MQKREQHTLEEAVEVSRPGWEEWCGGREVVGGGMEDVRRKGLAGGRKERKG